MVLADCHAPLRREDSLECRWTGARDDADALRTSLLASAVAVTWVHEGAPLAFAGVVNEGQAGEGLVWLLTLGFQVAAPAPWGPFGHLFCAVEWSRRC
jgi:hypothetical protein